MKTKELFARRQRRARARLSQTRELRPRLSVFRSGKHIYAQIIDDRQGVTLAAASSLEKSLRDQASSGVDKAAAARVGAEIAERAKAAGVSKVVFDRGGYAYHGRVKALAEAAREAGLDF